MRLFRRSVIVYQYIAFLFLSYLYSYILASLDSGESAFNLVKSFNFIVNNKILLLLVLVSMVSVYLVKRWSKFVILLFMILTLLSEFDIFFYKLDKIVLVLIFFHVLIFFTYYLLWNIELEDVVYRPGYSKYDCWKKFYYDFVSEIELKSGVIFPIKLTNWDQRGIFCLIDESEQKMDMRLMESPIILRLKFENETFEEYGKIVYSYDKGYGLKFIKTKNEKFNVSVGKWNINPLIFDKYAVPIIDEIIKKIHNRDKRKAYVVYKYFYNMETFLYICCV